MQSPILELTMTGRKIGASVSLLLVALTICSERAAYAQVNNFYAGTASNGQAVNVGVT